MIRHLSKFTLHLLGALFGVLLLALIAFGLRLSLGPISVGFLTPVIEAALTEELEGLTPSISDTVIVWNGIDHDVVLAVVGFDLRDDQGRLIARLPRADLGLSPRGLLRGHLLPGSIIIREAGIRLTRRADGGLELGFGGSIAASSPAAEAPEAPLSAIAAVERMVFAPQGRLAGLDQLRLEGTALVFDDQATGRVWSGADVSLRFSRDPAVPVLTLNGRLSSAGESIGLDLHSAFHPDDGSATISLDFDNWTPALFDVGGRFMGALGGLVMPLDGHADLVFDVKDGPRWARLRLKGGAGGLDLPALYPDGLRLSGLGLDIEADFRRKTARLDNLTLDLGGSLATASGTARFDQAGLGLDLDLGIDKLAVDRLPSLWPVTLAVNGWRWVKQNMNGGMVYDARFKLHAAPGVLDLATPPADILTGQFRIDQTNVTYLDGLPPATNLSGSAEIDANHITITADTGKVDMGAAGVVNLKSATATISDFLKPDQSADIAFDLTGDARAALTLLDRQPLGYARKIGIDPAGIEGTVTASTRFRFPLIADLGLDRLEIAHKALIKGLKVTKAALGLDLTDADLSVTLDQNGAKGQGQGRLGPAPVTLDWQQDFTAKPGALSTQMTVQTTIDQALLDRFAVKPGLLLKGAFPATITLQGRTKAIDRIGITADLTPVSSTIAELGWSKATGQPGHFTGDLLPQSTGGYRLDAITLSAPELAVAGSLDFTGDLRLMAAKLTDLKIGRSAVSLTAGRASVKEPLAVSLRGRVIDLSAYLSLPSAARRPESERPDPAGVDSLPDFILDGTADQVILDPHLAASAVQGRVSHIGGLWRTIDLDAAVGKGAKMRAELTSGDGERQFRLTSSGEAGALVRVLGLYEGAVGGTLSLSGRIDDRQRKRPMDAHLEMRDFKLQGTPVLAQLLTLGSLSGIVDALNGEGVSFSAVEADLHQGDWVIRIDRGKAFGDSIGASFAGTYDLWGRSISIGGTIVPSYAFNQFIGKIPLLGTILTGGEGGGLFAFTYSVTGAIEKPNISVNPLSALAPGILRDIISAIDGTDAAAGAKTPPVVPPLPSGGNGASGAVDGAGTSDPPSAPATNTPAPADARPAAPPARIDRK